MKTYKYFSQKADFDRCDPPCKIEDMDHHTMQQFDQAREIAGIPFVVNSAFRTRQHELSQGRDGTSSHTTGTAMDLKINNARERFLIINALLQTGFTRIGIAQTFIHADLDGSKVQKVKWIY